MSDSLTLEETEDMDALERALEETDVPLAGDGEAPVTEVEEPEKEVVEAEVKEPEPKIDYADKKVVPVEVMVAERKKYQTAIEEQQRQIDELKASAGVQPEPEPEPEPEFAAYTDEELEAIKDEFGDDYAERAVKERQFLLNQQEQIKNLREQQAELVADKNTSHLKVVLAETPLLRDWYNGQDGDYSKEFAAAVRFAKAAVVAFPNQSEVEQNKWVVEQVKREFGIVDTPTPTEKKAVTKVNDDPLSSITDVPGGEAVSKKSSDLELLTAINTGKIDLDSLTESQRDKVEELLEAESEWG